MVSAPQAPLPRISDSSRPGRLRKRVAEQVQTQNEQKSESHSKEQFSKPLRRLPAWLDHFNAHDLGVLFRCSVAAWVASLMFIGPSLHTIGTATFFAWDRANSTVLILRKAESTDPVYSVVLSFLPPSGIVFIFVLEALTLLTQ